VPVNDALVPHETLVTDARADRDIARERITIERRRLSEDERIQSVVMDALQNSGPLTGKIGVESHQSVVTLTGWTNTVGQAERAGRYARGVTGVKTVQNLIRARVGGMVSS
jgi:osmotically-inducible protein OsmY